MTKTLQEIKEFVASTTVNVLEMPDGDYPYYYLGEEYLAWAEYIDFSAFNPFKVLGLEVIYYSVKVEDTFYEDATYYEATSKLENQVDANKRFSQTLKDLEAVSFHVTIMKYD